MLDSYGIDSQKVLKSWIGDQFYTYRPSLKKRSCLYTSSTTITRLNVWYLFGSLESCIISAAIIARLVMCCYNSKAYIRPLWYKSCIYRLKKLYSLLLSANNTTDLHLILYILSIWTQQRFFIKTFMIGIYRSLKTFLALDCFCTIDTIIIAILELIFHDLWPNISVNIWAVFGMKYVC